jgi:hypothetical protein
MKELNNELNSPLNLNEINTNSDSYSQEIINANPQIRGSQEKIVHLTRGYKVWIKICTIFGISSACFVLFLCLAIKYADKYPFLFAFVGLSALGIFSCFVMVSCGSNGFIIVNPNEAVVYQYYGKYLGTLKDNGYFYGFPLAKTTRVSLRSNQYNGNRLKVNERDGNPVELGIIVVWRIGDTAKAVFDVIGYNDFIQTQSEAAIRYIGCKYPYEPIVPGEVSLRGGQEIINKELREELERRVKISGIIIEDARVTEISYGREIAVTMLQKQASNSAVIAKDAIVKGASNAVMDSLKEFESKGYKFTNEQKTRFVTTLMRTICMSSDVSKIMGT